MKKAAHDTRLEYEAPTAEVIRLGTEDILSKSTDTPVRDTFERDFNI